MSVAAHEAELNKDMLPILRIPNSGIIGPELYTDWILY